MKVLITGATGMVGRGVLLECLDHSDIKNVLTIGRSKVDIDHPKLQQVKHNNFSDFSSISPEFEGFEAAYLCMGVSAAGLSEEKYSELTYDYTIALAKELVKQNSKMTCIYVSGQGTDSSEKGRIMWARIKGKTENDLLKMGFSQAFMFRPGAIIPLRGIKSRTKLYQFVYDYFMWGVKFMKWVSPNSVVNTTQIGMAMISATKKGYKKSIVDPADIIDLAKQ